jgi:hypothetical protein
LTIIEDDQGLPLQDEAPETLDIVDRNQRKIRTLEFVSPVKQVINAFVQKEDMRKVS